MHVCIVNDGVQLIDSLFVEKLPSTILRYVELAILHLNLENT